MFARADWAPIGYKGFYEWDEAAVALDPEVDGSTPVTTFANPAGYNVPGSADYDPAAPDDYLLGSEDDTPDATP
jgi:hypothetical protein